MKLKYELYSGISSQHGLLNLLQDYLLTALKETRDTFTTLKTFSLRESVKAWLEGKRLLLIEHLYLLQSEADLVVSLKLGTKKTA